ncbi:MAG: TonB-dependent receptor [Gammaproteobacteria bacterium]|nr:TonB-dependent receptor [Gammaproteobacteria bacterium]
MFKRFFISSAIAATVALPVQSLYAQDNANDEELEVVVVTGIRASLEKGLDIKRESMNVVDAIVSEDIGKFPDNNVVEALQRVTGVQVTDRGAGEINTVTIRGLTDVTTLVNGRNIFTSSGRSVALADIPASLLDQAVIYKTRSADLFESGIAGVIDVKTQRPFNFEDSKVVVAARMVNQEQADEWDPNISILLSDRWDTGIGEIGALFNASFATTNFRDQNVTAGAQIPFLNGGPPAHLLASTLPDNITGWFAYQRIFPSYGEEGAVFGDAGYNGLVGEAYQGATVWRAGLDLGLPTAAGSTLPIDGVETEYLLGRDAVFWNDFTGERERPAWNISLQWAPNDTSEYLFEAFYNGYRQKQFNSLNFYFVDWWEALNPADPVEVYPGTNVIKSRYINAPFNFTSGDYQTAETDSYVYALGGKWDVGDNLKLKSEVVLQDSTYHSEFFALRLARVPERLFVDFNAGGGIPALTLLDAAGNNANALAADPDSYWIDWMYDNGDRDEGDAVTFTFDGEMELGSDFFQTLKFGVRWDDRSAKESSRGLEGGPGAGVTIDQFPNLTTVNSSDFFDGKANVVTEWAVADGSDGGGLMTNHDALVAAYNFDPAYLILRPDFDISEINTAVYGMVDFVAGNLDGQFGLRYVTYDTDMTFIDYPLGKDEPEGAVQYSDSASHSKVLPSFALRYSFMEDLVGRLAYGQTLRSPNFADLNATIFFFPDVTNIGYGTGDGGNPDLEPTESTNIDLTLEWYFADASSLYVTYFDRDIEGFVVPFRNIVQHNYPDDIPDRGLYDHVVSQPANASNGELDGFELGMVWFPENLPGLLDGFGIQASYTILNSSQDIPQADESGAITGTINTPIFGVSDSSYSIVLAYDRPNFDMRLSYVSREAFQQRNEAALFANPLAIWRSPEESMDFQLTWNVTDMIDVMFDATNITEEMYHEYYVNPQIHNFSNSLYSRTYALGARFSF